jgi:two-component system response regulator YesN
VYLLFFLNADELLPWQSRVERIKEYVQANLSGDLRAGTVAGKFGMNETTLRHLFQKQEDESFRGYVERMRMMKALQLLSEGKWVKEVIREAGYKNRSTFNNAFKKRFKHTPGFFKN